MRILHIITSLDVGGAELMLSRLIDPDKQLRDETHAVVCLRNLGTVGCKLRDQGVHVIALGLNSIFSLPYAFFRLSKVIRTLRPDVVQTWMYHADLIGGCAARISGSRSVVWNIRNTDVYFGHGISRSTRWVVLICALFSSIIPSKVICVSECARDKHIGLGYSSKKMRVIGNGFEVEKFARSKERRISLRAELGLPPEVQVVGSIGRFNEYKDHGNFVRAAGILARARPDVYFIMAGRHISTENSVLLKLIKSSGFPDRFRLVSDSKDVVDIYSAIDIFCLHSKSEGFPNVLGEAMCAGLPCVATAVGDVPLILGDCGVCVAPNDSSALADAIGYILDQPVADREWLGNRAKVRIQDNWTMGNIRSKYSYLYEEVMGNE